MERINVVLATPGVPTVPFGHTYTQRALEQAFALIVNREGMPVLYNYWKPGQAEGSVRVGTTVPGSAALAADGTLSVSIDKSDDPHAAAVWGETEYPKHYSLGVKVEQRDAEILPGNQRLRLHGVARVDYIILADPADRPMPDAWLPEFSTMAQRVRTAARERVPPAMMSDASNRLELLVQATLKGVDVVWITEPRKAVSFALKSDDSPSLREVEATHNDTDPTRWHVRLVDYSVVSPDGPMPEWGPARTELEAALLVVGLLTGHTKQA